MNIINLTPHQINLVRKDGETMGIPASGQVARVSSIAEEISGDCPFVLERIQFGEVIDLPEAQEGVILVVSALVRTALPDRGDLASPGQLVRDDQGNVVGCRSLICN